jgi:hypothetical protein
MQPTTPETKSFLLQEYCMFWSFEMFAKNESIATLKANGWNLQKSQNCKLQQSTLSDMNSSLLG